MDEGILDDDELEELEQLKLFEKMEKFAGQASFAPHASIIAEFMAGKLHLDSTISELPEDDLSSTASDLLDIDTALRDPTPDSLRSAHLVSPIIRSEEEDTVDNVARKSELEPTKSPIAYKSPENVLASSASGNHSCDEVADEDVFSKVMESELKHLLNLREEIEESREQLEESRAAFLKFKNEEIAKLDAQRASISVNSKTMEKLRQELEEVKKNMGKDCNIERAKESDLQALRQELKDLKKKLCDKNSVKTTRVLESLQSEVGEMKKRLSEKDSLISRLNDQLQRLTASSGTFQKKCRTNNESDNVIDNGGSSTDLSGASELEKTYPNGTKKFVSRSRNFVRTVYKNGDIKEKRGDGSIHYFFVEHGLRHYTYPSGLEMTSYSNGQIERKNSDGSMEILYPNGCVKFVRCDGKVEYIFPDNTVHYEDEHGNSIVTFPNGQKEVINALWKKRLYPDGTVKIIYSSGASETRYPNGRVRVKNSSGVLLSDTNVKDKSTEAKGRQKNVNVVTFQAQVS